MSADDRATHLRISRSAAEWARAKLEFEGVAERERALKQFTLRLPEEDVAFVDALASRLGSSRNQIMGIFLRSAAAEVYEQFPDEQRVEIVREVGATLGRAVEVEWLRERNLGLSEHDEALIPDHIKEEMRHKP